VHDSFLLVLVVVIAVGFDFTNGFHDTANSVAPTIATGALKPRHAVLMSGVLNIVGAFLSLKVAASIANGIVSQTHVILPVVFAGLTGAIAWNVVTWYLGVPSSSSHALVGGVVGAMFAHAGGAAVLWGGLISKVVAPAIAAPTFALLIAAIATTLSRYLTTMSDGSTKAAGMRFGQIGSSALLSIAHGTNDAQKTMGIITLALVANGTLSNHAGTPVWVVILCGVTIGLGTYLGGWRIIRTVGHGFTELSPTQGFAAQITSSVVILSSSRFGMPLSTTHVASGSILGSGIGIDNKSVRWAVARRVALAWLVTLPAAGLCGALSFFLAHELGYSWGELVTSLLTASLCAVIFRLSRRDRISAENVNDKWGGHTELLEKVAELSPVISEDAPT
jgi:inorganic phosphate transporter, PiT family